MPTYIFTPPTSDTEQMRVYNGRDKFRPVPSLANRLFRYVRRDKLQLSVLKLDGVWITKTYPTTQETLDAERYYAGGHIYEVSGDEADDLIAAGFHLELKP